MRNLFALLVAINQYDQPEINDLSGCLNDLEGIELSLDSYCQNNRDVKLNKRILKNQEATRQAVIDNFALFNQATEQDVCLFYFSGHGAPIDAPKEFWNESDQMLETLVCHRQKGNDNLLIDKELSYLIAKAQKGRALHFVVITDSCHSGSNTKDPTYRVRSTLPNLNTRAVADYLGRAEYAEGKDEAGVICRLSPPVGKHFKLGACTSSESAKEQAVGGDGKIRGIFTYSLLQVLKDNGYKLSYANLMRKTRIKTLALAADQSPQFETIALEPYECNRVFLNGLLEGETPTFQVSYDQAKSDWVINVGHIYGVQEGDIILLGDGDKTSITQVGVASSQLDFGPLTFHDRAAIYDATVMPSSKIKLNLAFSPDSNEDAKNTLLALLKESPSAVEFDADKGINYMVHAVNNGLALTHPAGHIPVFSRIQGQGQGEAKLFLKLVGQIAQWHHIIAIAKPKSSIREEEVAIKLSNVANPQGKPDPDSLRATALKNWQSENVFRYIFDETVPGGPWHPPQFRLSIENNSQTKDFWVSALYCGSGVTADHISTLYSITNQFLEKEQLKHGHPAKMTDKIYDPNTDRRIEYASIPLNILDDYFDQGYNEIKDLIKIFVATEEIDTEEFKLPGIPIDTQGILGERSPGRQFALAPPQPDWRTFELPITIVKPRDLGLLNIRQDKNFYGVTIVGHPAFSAHIILSTLEEFIRSTRLNRDRSTATNTSKGQADKSKGQTEQYSYMSRPETLLGNENVKTIQLTNGLGDVEGVSVIEFYRTKGAEFITPKQPWRLRIDPKILANEATRKLILVGYSAQARKYYALGTMDETHEISVERLPDASPSQISGLGTSIKLLLLSVRPDFDLAPYPTSMPEAT